MWVTYEIATGQLCSPLVQANDGINISNLVKTPELESSVHIVPTQALKDPKIGMRLPFADFYLDTMVSEALQP